MAVSVGTAYVSIIPSTKGFAKSIEREVKSESTGRDMGKKAGRGYTKGFGASMGGLKTLIAGAGLAAAGAAAVAFAKSTVTAASDANEAANAVNVTYGKAAKGVAKLAKQSARAMGLSGTEFSALAVRFSSFTDTVAGPGGDSVKVLDKLTTRAADFASVMNIDVAQAAEVFQSGLSGETEPLKRYGIDLSDAAVQAYALSKGIKQGNEKLTEAQKIQARYGLLMEKTQKTQGDFKNTSTGMANAQRILNAEWTNSKAKLGTALLPSLGMATSKLSAIVPVLTTALVPAFQQLGKWATEVITKLVQNLPKVKESIKSMADKVRENWPTIKEVVGGVAAAFQRVTGLLALAWQWFSKLPTPVKQFTAALVVLTKLGVIGALAGAIRGLAGAFGALNMSLLANPITWIVIAVVAAVALLGAAVWWLWNHNEKFRKRMTEIWTDLKKTLTEFKAYWDAEIWPTLKDIVPILAGVMVASFELVAGAITVITDAVKFAWGYVQAFLEFLNDTPLGAIINLPGEANPTGSGGSSSFASGGMIPGTGTRDTTPVLTTPGEWVLTRRQVAQVSPARLEAWRQGGPPPGAGSGVQVGQLIINNPKAESASDSLPRSIRKLQHVSAR